MRETGQWTFEASPGETVSIRIVPRQSEIVYVGVWFDGAASQPINEPYPYRTYRFDLSNDAGQRHVIGLECNFATRAPDTASYDLWISGSLGSREFLRTVRKTDANHDIDIVVTVPPVGVKSPTVIEEKGGPGSHQPGKPGPRREPEGRAEIAPEIIPEVRPEVISEVAPPGTARRGRPEVIAEVAPEIRPEIAPEVRPKLTAEIGPEINPEVVPEATPLIDWDYGELAPEIRPEMMPEGPGGGAPEPELIPETKPSSPHKARAKPPLRDIITPRPGPEPTAKPKIKRGARAGTSTIRGSAKKGGKKAAPKKLGSAKERGKKAAPKKLRAPQGGAPPKTRSKHFAVHPRHGKGGGRPATAQPRRLRARGSAQAGRLLTRKERVVNVGFAPALEATRPLKTNTPLGCGQQYYFWLEVGHLLAESLESRRPVALPVERLPRRARLKVALFSFKDELEIQDGADVGELRLEDDGTAIVSRRAALPLGLSKVQGLTERRLFFPVRTPLRPGTYRLRCSIYYRQVLVQSRLITARVMSRPAARPNALMSTVDYTLSRDLRSDHLAGFSSHRLSMMLNRNGDGTVGLRFWGEKEFKSEAEFDAQELQDLIDLARGALRTVSWGDADPWREDREYRYTEPADFARLSRDLVFLAKKGYSIYDLITDRFSRPDDSATLADLLDKPGQLQLALKESARQLIPSAMIYDYRLDNGLNDEDIGICPSFKTALGGKAPLEETSCFKGDCPTRNQDNVVCPSGFWGYRHYLGLPLSVAKAPELPTEIDWQDAPHLTLAVSTALPLREHHENALSALKAGWTWRRAETRDEAFTMLRDAKPHFVYFYCHCGLDRNEPYIKVGPLKGPRITRADLRAKGIGWIDPRPLVFINGCRSTGLEPKQAIEFVSGFIQVAGAAGVIGTEITVFEPLAQAFAEDCLRRFLVGSKTLGESVRNARLALLKSLNPLGLVYTPFAVANLRMVSR
jgi:hypothetical protein